MRSLPEFLLRQGLPALLCLSFSGLRAADLVWNTPEGGAWTNGGMGWYVQGDPQQTDTAFTNGDNVSFGQQATKPTSLEVAGTVTAGNIVIETGSSYQWTAGVGGTLAATSLTLEDGSALSIGAEDAVLPSSLTAIALGDNSSLTWNVSAAPQGTLSGSGAFSIRMAPATVATLAPGAFLTLASSTELQGRVTISNATVSGNMRILNGTTAAAVSADSIDVRLENATVTDWLSLGTGSFNTTNGFTLTVGEGSSIYRFQAGVQNSVIVGDITLNIEGGIIGQGNSGYEYSRFGFTGQNGSLTGNIYLNVSGGRLAAPYVVFGGFGSQAGVSHKGDVFIHLTGGSIESYVLATSSWQGFVDGNVTALLEGGTLGLDGQTRDFAPGQAVGPSQASRPVTGSVSIIFTGGADGYGTTIRGNYSVLAGGNSGGIAIGGNSLVSLQNITNRNADGVSGFANFTGLISGGNKATGQGVVGTRTLQFSGYTTDAAAQFRFFDSAFVEGASQVRLTNVNNSDIGAWQITGNSTLTATAAATLGGGSTAIDTDSSLIYDPAAATDETLGSAITGPGQFIKRGANRLALAGNVQIGTTTVEDGILSVQSADPAELGVVKIGGGAALDLQSAETRALSIVGTGGNFEGSLASFAGTLSVASGARQTLDGPGGASAALVAQSGSELELRHRENTSYASLAVEPTGTVSIVQTGGTASPLTLASATLGNNANLSLTLAPGAAATPAVILANPASSSLGDGVNLTLTAEPGAVSGKTISLTLIQNTGLDLWDKTWTLHMAGELAEYAATLVIENGNLMLNGFLTHLPTYAETPVAETGGALLDEARGNVPVDSPLGQLIQGLQNQIAAGAPGSVVSRTMAAAAGASGAGLGLAQRGMLRNNMTELRNRLLPAGDDPCASESDLPRTRLWIQALGGAERTERQQDYSGYTLESIGGMLGVDVAINRCYTAGASIHASYGKFNSHSAETATGDLDDYGASLFVRFRKGRWTHLLLAAGSGYHATLKRTVLYNGGGYRAKGSPDGYGVGGLYEVDFDIPLGDEGSALLQPLFQASLTHTALRSYSESQAGNAGLRYGSQEMTTGAFALGARLTTEIGENVFNRAAVWSLRANVAQDVGDNDSSAVVGFVGRAAEGTVRSSRVGRTALQIGSALNIPVCVDGALFFDVHADFRSRQNSVHGGVGYAYSF